MRPDKLMECPKCRYCSGDDWRQCKGDCPMPMSPHFNPKHELAEVARQRCDKFFETND